MNEIVQEIKETDLAMGLFRKSDDKITDDFINWNSVQTPYFELFKQDCDAQSLTDFEIDTKLQKIFNARTKAKLEPIESAVVKAYFVD